MFRVSIAPIIRSASNCNCSFWYRSYNVSEQQPSASVAYLGHAGGRLLFCILLHLVGSYKYRVTMHGTVNIKQKFSLVVSVRLSFHTEQGYCQRKDFRENLYLRSLWQFSTSFHFVKNWTKTIRTLQEDIHTYIHTYALVNFLNVYIHTYLIHTYIHML